MTNPVILLGTQANGETLPVQVNESGQLVAQGLEGPPGPQGEQGIQGEPGPAGEPGSVIRSIQHVQHTTEVNAPISVVNIVAVNEAKSVIQYTGQIIDYGMTNQKEWNNDVSLSFVGGSRVELQRQANYGSTTVCFSVIEYV